MARDKIDKVFDFVERKLDLLRSWGINVRKVAPLRWYINDTDFLHMGVSRQRIVVDTLGRYSLRKDWDISLNQRWGEVKKELDEVLNDAIEAAILHLFRQSMPNSSPFAYRNGRLIAINFRLNGNRWVFEVVAMGGEQLAAVHGSKRQSPINKFEDVWRLLFLLKDL